MQRQGLDHPAADRRGHDLARAHGGQGRPASTTARSSGSRTPPGRCPPPPRCSHAEPARRSCWPTSRPTTTRCAPGTPPSTTGRWSRSTTPAPTRRRSTGRTTGRRRRAQPGVHVLDDYDLAELREYIDWQPFFNAWEMKGKFPDILNNPTTGEAAAQALRRRAGDARPDHRGEVAHRPRRATASSPPARVGDDVEVYTDDVAHRGAHHAAPPAPAGRAPRRGPQPVARRLRRARARPGSPTTSARFAVTAGLGLPRSGSRRSRPSTTTTPRSCSSRSPTGSPRRSPSGCTSGCAPSSGATPPTRTLGQRGPDRRALHRHPPRAGLPRLPRPHREADPVGAARRGGQHRHRAHRVDGDVAGRGGVGLVLLATRSRSTSSSAGSAATRSPTTPSARAGRWPRPSAGSRPTWATTRRTEGPGTPGRPRRRARRRSGPARVRRPATRRRSARGPRRRRSSRRRGCRPG